MNLSDDEKQFLKERIYKDEVLQTFFGSIFKKRKFEIDLLSLDDHNWALKRANKDGKLSELDWLATLLKPKKE